MKLKRAFLGFSVLYYGVVLNQNVLAQPEAPIQPTMPVTDYPSMAAFFFRTIFSLFLVFVLTYAVLRIIKRQSTLRQRQKGWIHILDYQALGPNRGLYLLEVMEATYIVGAAEGQISIIKEIDRESEHWLEVEQGLQEQEELVTPQLERLVLKGINFFKASDSNQETFKKQLDLRLNKQVNRSRNLRDKASKEEKERE